MRAMRQTDARTGTPLPHMPRPGAPAVPQHDYACTSDALLPSLHRGEGPGEGGTSFMVRAHERPS
jgi:hypothetical protein